jgi:hypothetical protein
VGVILVPGLEVLTVDEKILQQLKTEVAAAIKRRVVEAIFDHRALVAKGSYNPALHPRGPDGKWVPSGGERGPHGNPSPQQGNPNRGDRHGPSEDLQHPGAPDPKAVQRWGSGVDGVVHAIEHLPLSPGGGGMNKDAIAKLLAAGHKFPEGEINSPGKFVPFEGAKVDTGSDTPALRQKLFRDYCDRRIVAALVNPDKKDDGVPPPYFMIRERGTGKDKVKPWADQALAREANAHVDGVIADIRELMRGQRPKAVLRELIKRGVWPIPAASGGGPGSSDMPGDVPGPAPQGP